MKALFIKEIINDQCCTVLDLSLCSSENLFFYLCIPFSVNMLSEMMSVRVLVNSTNCACIYLCMG